MWPCDVAIALAALDHETANRTEQVRRKRVGHDTTRELLDAALARERRLARLIVSYADLTHDVVVNGSDPADIAKEWAGVVAEARAALADTPEAGS
jgi:hypothetical protein